MVTSSRRRLLAHFVDVEANQRLTTLAGLLLMPLLAIEMITTLSVRAMLPVHVAVGLWLLPILAVKMASTGYRMARYYLRDHDYFSAGPPAWLPRLLAPIVVVSTVGLFGSGTILWAIGPAARDPWLALHKVSFVIWAGSTGIHVLIHLRQTLRVGMAQLTQRTPGSTIRRRVAVAAVLVGLVIGITGVIVGPAWPAGSLGDGGGGSENGQ